jgi:hypothetical protein
MRASLRAQRRKTETGKEKQRKNRKKEKMERWKKNLKKLKKVSSTTVAKQWLKP